MKITRTMPEGEGQGWVPVANAAARDYRMSWRARGLLAELLSYPNNWDTSIDQLVRKARAEGGNCEGRDAMLKAMAELVSAGYVHYIRTRDANNRWLTTIDVCDDPDSFAVRHPESQCVGDPVCRDVSVSADQCIGDQGVITKTDTHTDTKKDLSQRSAEQDSESLASLAVDADTSTVAALREAKLKAAYDAIDELGDEGRRAHLLLIEQKRPKIYREARNASIAQIRNGPTAPVLKTERGVRVIDQLSYKYIAQHYIIKSDDRCLPDWLDRHLKANLMA